MIQSSKLFNFTNKVENRPRRQQKLFSTYIIYDHRMTELSLIILTVEKVKLKLY